MKKISLVLMIGLYVLAGINHFIMYPLYEKIVPRFLAEPRAIVYLSGVCEIILGLLLIPPSMRRSAAWGIIVLLIAIFPANIQMALNYWHQQDPRLWISLVRLPLQFLLIAWAYSFTRFAKPDR